MPVQPRRSTRRGNASQAQPSDPWLARLAFHVLKTHGPLWITLWLALFLGALVTLVALAGPWAPGLVGAVAAATIGGRQLVRRLGSRRR